MKESGRSEAALVYKGPDPGGQNGNSGYYQGRLTHYLLAGEWYQALPEPTSFGVSDAASRRPSTRT